MEIKFPILKPKLQKSIRVPLGILTILTYFFITYQIVIYLASNISRKEHSDIEALFLIFLVALIFLLYSVFERVTKNYINASQEVGYFTISTSHIKAHEITVFEIPTEHVNKIKLNASLGGWSKYNHFAYRLKIFNKSDKVIYSSIVKAKVAKIHLLDELRKTKIAISPFG